MEKIIMLLLGLCLGALATVTYFDYCGHPSEAPTPTVTRSADDLTVDLAAVLVDVHGEARKAQRELKTTRTEAFKLLKAMAAEIERLRKAKPTIES